VTAGAGCNWTAATSESWINISNPNGAGNGQVNFTSPLTLGSRSGTIFLTNGSGECRISQSGLAGVQEAADLRWLATLDLRGGSAQVVVNERLVVHERAAIESHMERRPMSRVDAVVTRGQGTPGIWRFSVPGAALSNFNVLAGMVKGVTADSITFALSGRPGERIAFTFRTDE
jgi:hypothetical protein